MEALVIAEKARITIKNRVILESATFKAIKGELTGIIGPNGAGKTTLLRAILGMEKVNSGRLLVFGFPSSRPSSYRSKVGYMPQKQSFAREFPFTASDVVGTGLLNPDYLLKAVPDRELRILRALDSVGMIDFAHRSFHELSGGEQQKILLARSLVREPELLLLDEPTNGLDFSAQKIFMDLLIRLKIEKQLALILVSHDIVSIASCADQLVCVDGSMHVHGQPAKELKGTSIDSALHCQYDYLLSMDDREERLKNG